MSLTRRRGGVAFLIGLGLAASAAIVATQQNPAFRAGTDLLMIDVSVLDKARQPVAGLNARDFTVFVDGKQLPVVAFKAIDVPPPPPPPPPAALWVRDVAPDVSTNTSPVGRLVVILIDDYAFLEAWLDQGTILKARQSAHKVVDSLGPDDRAAVIFADNNNTAQTFTSDRALLRKAIDSAPLFPGVEPRNIRDWANPRDSGSCDCGVCPISALERIALALRPVPDRRKTVMYISGGSYTPIPEPKYGAEREQLREEHCVFKKREALHDALRQLQLSNVTIQSVDPKGLDPRWIDPRQAAYDPLKNKWAQRIEFLRTVAETTGGRAVVNNNDMELEVPALLAESSSYYLLGVERPAPRDDGQLHPIKVEVSRRDVEVRTRKGYFDPTKKDLEDEAKARAAGDLVPLMSGAMPGSGVPLELAAAPFLMDNGEPVLAMALSVGASATASPTASRRVETIELVAALFNPETAEAPQSQKQVLNIEWLPAETRFTNYELLSRLPATPGRYELRIAAKTGDGRTGSLYTSVEVPNFDDALVLSGLVLSAKPSPPAAPPDVLTPVLKYAPTSRRVFRKTDELLAFMRIYQKTPAFATATVKTRLTDAKGEVLADQEEKVEGASAGARSVADYEIELPLSDIDAGDYLLSVDVGVGAQKAQRQLRFKVEQ
jgi:VWFA-related protein